MKIASHVFSIELENELKELYDSIMTNKNE
jgi:hypothetical protein